MILHRLLRWPVARIALHPGGSNYVFVAQLLPGDECPESAPLLAIYKPRSGERPLRDFPVGTLYRRERAAYLLSRSLGWPNIPPTVIRDGPEGAGSVQLFIDHDPDTNYFTMRESSLPLFEPVAAFDLLTNNADRKGGACLLDETGKLWSIDHGLTFNPYARQRTVMWEFCGRPFTPATVESLRRLRPRLSAGSELSEELEELLSPGDVEALRSRLDRMLESPIFPMLDPNRNVPWPFL